MLKGATGLGGAFFMAFGFLFYIYGQIFCRRST
jgi:hypothetical protein